MGFNQAWIFLTDVLPRAIKKHGGFDPEALRKAALETDIPEGGTIQGYGVKFFPPGHKMAGQNERSSPVVMQYVKGETKIAWPTAIKHHRSGAAAARRARLRALTLQTHRGDARRVPRAVSRTRTGARSAWPSSPSPA